MQKRQFPPQISVKVHLYIFCYYFNFRYLRKCQGYHCRPNLSSSLGTCEPFLAMFNTRQEECFKSQRCGVSASRPPALFLPLCVFPFVQLPRELMCYFKWVGWDTEVFSIKVEVQGHVGGEEGLSVERGSDLWIKFIRRWEWATLLLQNNLSVFLVCVSPLVLGLPQLWKSCGVDFSLIRKQKS